MNFCERQKKNARFKNRAFVFMSNDVFSVVAIDPLPPLVALLRLDRQGRDRACFEAAQRDRLAGFLAIAVGAIIDPRQRLVDLGDQLALPITRAQLDGAVGFR